jgi:hypothetical protein
MGGARAVLDKVFAELVQLTAAIDVEVSDSDKRQLRTVREALEVLGIREGGGKKGQEDDEEEEGIEDRKTHAA